MSNFNSNKFDNLLNSLKGQPVSVVFSKGNSTMQYYPHFSWYKSPNMDGDEYYHLEDEDLEVNLEHASVEFYTKDIDFTYKNLVDEIVIESKNGTEITICIDRGDEE